MTQLQQQYLDAMGIPVWQRRDLPLPIVVETKPEAVMLEAKLVVNEAIVEMPAEAPQPDIMNDVSALSWPELDSAIRSCQLCEQHVHCTQRVMGEGDPQTEVMFVAARSHGNEYMVSALFNNDETQLFHAMLATLQLTAQQIYVTSVIKCHSTEESAVTVQHVSLCRAYLHRQIDLLKPKLIVLMGQEATSWLLGSSSTFESNRNQLHQVSDVTSPLLVTYHPSQLLQSPLDKRNAWQDLLQMQKILTE